MPRPTRARTSLPGHQKAAKIDQVAEDVDMDAQGEEREEEDAEPARPPNKQKKTDKLIARREALLAKITGGATPYSKSHERRTKRAARPSEHLNTTLAEVEAVLPELPVEAADEGMDGKGPKAAVEKGAPKLTQKKRQKVLAEEAARLSAVMANPAFVTSPWETLRLHTQNTLKTAVHHKAKPTKASRK
ncbi:hypothetical protein RQP46_003015 [Phenoliferia psychrophenolica]